MKRFQNFSSLHFKVEFKTYTEAKWGKKFINAQTLFDAEVLRGCEPYIPLLTGRLIKSGIDGTKIGSGLVQWIAPYSKRQYYLPRVGTQTGRLRGGFWFKRWQAVHGQRTLSNVRKAFAK